MVDGADKDGLQRAKQLEEQRSRIEALASYGMYNAGGSTDDEPPSVIFVADTPSPEMAKWFRLKGDRKGRPFLTALRRGELHEALTCLQVHSVMKKLEAPPVPGTVLVVAQVGALYTTTLVRADGLLDTDALQ
jgi:hypothetical protein